MVGRFLRKSAFLRPIVDRIDAKEVYLFIVLLGILPSVLDLSIFWVGRGSHLEFFIGDPAPLVRVAHTVPMVLLPVAVVLLVWLRKPWYVIGVLPILISLALTAMEFTGVREQYAISSWALAVSYKLAFLFFIIYGHVRSPAFIFAMLVGFSVVLAHNVVMVVVVLMFALAAFLGRFVYLAIVQNHQVFRNVKKTSLAVYLIRSFFIWCPILLFSVPYFYVTSRLRTIAEDMIYANNFIERYHVYTEMTIDQLIATYSNPDGAQVKSILEEWKFPSTRHVEIQRDIKDALINIKLKYIDTKNFKDYREPARRFREIVIALTGGNDRVDRSLAFMIELVSARVERIAIQRKFWGRSEIALDVQLSIYNTLAKKQIKANEELDAREKLLNESLNKDGPIAFKARDWIVKSSADLQAGTAQTVDVRRTSAKLKVKKDLDAIKSSTQTDLIDTIPGAARKGFDSVAPEELTGISSSFGNDDSCGIDLGCHVANMIKNLLRNVYRKQRAHVASVVARESDKLHAEATERLNRSIANTEAEVGKGIDAIADDIKGSSANLKQKVDSTTNEYADKVNTELTNLQKTASEYNKKVKEGVDRGVESVNDFTKNAVLTVHTYLMLADLLTTISFVFVIITSYLYVFSRVAFSDGRQLFVTLRDGEQSSASGAIKKWGNLYSIPADHTETFYVARRFEPSGRAPKLAVPQWPIAVLARFLNRAYFMDSISVKRRGQSSVDFRSVAGAEFVEWQLAEGEEVVFDYSRFVAMSESVRLSTCVSLRITSLLMGRPFFHIARGPGTLVLSTRGVPITDGDSSVSKSVSVERIIAYQKNAQFTVDSELNLLDIYFSGLYLSRNGDGLLIIDADPGTAKAKVGMVRFILKFIYPG